MNGFRITPNILIAHGVNLDLLGRREPDVYGSSTMADIEKRLREEALRLATGSILEVRLTFFQTNDEAAYLNELSKGWDGAIINPGSWTHTSLALADRLVGLRLPFVEVHLSNLSRREDFRQRSYSAPHALGVIHGFGVESYTLGLQALIRTLTQK